MDSTMNDESRWNAVLGRDATCDGAFFYSVRTTGVYCYPSCAARTPRRDNVAFHASADAARRAGFRACQRCRPDEAPPARRQAERITTMCRYLETHESIPSLAELGAHVGLAPAHAQKLFREATGVTPRAYAKAHRDARVRTALAREATVTDAVYASGYQSNARFYTDAPAMLGMTPTSFRAGAAHETIRVATSTCSLGHILVAATMRGVCAILLGDDEGSLRNDLARRFPRADVIDGDEDFTRWTRDAIALVDDPHVAVELPLDVRGTAFQQRVWKALRSIPAGETRSYTQIATSLDAPRAVRAVARACASNPVAVAIPCHRVLRSDGDLSGYRWGLERKRALIAREKLR